MNQLSWDLNLNKYSFAYNSSEHATIKQTPYEMMFGRQPRIPIDVVLPQIESLILREPILTKYNINTEFGDVTVLEDVQQTIMDMAPQVALKYLDNLKTTLNNCFEMATKNRN